MAIVIGDHLVPSVSEVRKYVDKRLTEYSEDINRAFFTHARYYVCTESMYADECTVYPFLCWGKPFPDFVNFSELYTDIEEGIGIDLGYSDCSAREYVPGFYIPRTGAVSLGSDSLAIEIYNDGEDDIVEDISLIEQWHEAMAVGSQATPHVPIIGIPRSVYEAKGAVVTLGSRYDLLTSLSGEAMSGPAFVNHFDITNMIAYRRASILSSPSPEFGDGQQWLKLGLEDYGSGNLTLESSAKFLTTKKDTGEYKTFYYPDGSGAGETPHPAGQVPEHLIVAVISVPLPPLRTSSRR